MRIEKLKKIESSLFFFRLSRVKMDGWHSMERIFIPSLKRWMRKATHTPFWAIDLCIERRPLGICMMDGVWGMDEVQSYVWLVGKSHTHFSPKMTKLNRLNDGKGQNYAFLKRQI
jgi:hypothetical protein